jgi:hypothetical protein
MDFPKSLLRGLHSSKAVTETGEVTAEAFIERESEHHQNTFEISINWEDDEFVEAFTLEQRE